MLFFQRMRVLRQRCSTQLALMTDGCSYLSLSGKISFKEAQTPLRSTLLSCLLIPLMLTRSHCQTNRYHMSSSNQFSVDEDLSTIFPSQQGSIARTSS